MKKKRTSLDGGVVIANDAVAGSKDPDQYKKMFEEEEPKEGYKFLRVSAILGWRGVVVSWSAQGIGFGEMSMRFENKKITVDDERMGKDFCDALIQEVLNKLPNQSGNKDINSLFVENMYKNITWDEDEKS